MTRDEKRDYMLKWRAENKDHVKESFENWYKRPDIKIRIREYNVKKYAKNREAVIRSVKDYYQCHKIERATYNKQYQEKNKDELKRKRDSKRSEINEKNRIYRNRPESREIAKNYRKQPQRRIAHNLRERIRKIFDNKNRKIKIGYFIDICGCSCEELKDHLQQQFTKGMTWENYGQWHIDHIVPCCLFDMTRTDHQRSCFYFKNLEPCWAKQNLEKHSKLEVCPV